MKNFLLADDQPIVRTGLKALISEHFGSCKIDEAENQAEIINCVKTKIYDIVILDINMEGTDFFQILSWFKIIAPNTRVLIFTMQSESILGRTCLQLGAWGFVGKKATQEELLLVIRRVLEGQKYISSNLASTLIDNAHKMTNPFQNLSARELEIVLLLDEGKTLVEICDLLHIEYSTVNTHKRKIFEKLMVANVLSLSRLMRTFHFEAEGMKNVVTAVD
jgi:two-component system, NarL family, invasion response regulator UvrY